MDELIRKGRAWKYGDNIDTDQIFPSKYMDIHEPPEAAKHLMEGVDIQFAKKVREGDLLVAGKNFGLGSIRGGIHLAFEHLKLGGIIAESFSRGFFRSCISEGIPILECPGVGGEIDTGDTIEVNFSKGEVKNITKTKMVKGNKLPDFLIQKIVAGGSIALLTKMFSERDTPRKGRNSQTKAPQGCCPSHGLFSSQREKFMDVVLDSPKRLAEEPKGEK